MGENRRIPGWLAEALAEAPRPAGPLEREWPLAAGQFRVAQAPGAGGARRVVLVARAPFRPATGVRMCSVLLCSDEADMAADTDIVVGPRHGAPFRMLIHGALAMPAEAGRLGACVGGLPRALRRAVWRAGAGLPCPAELLPGRGLPIRGPGDARWHHVLAELEVLREISGPIGWL